MFRKRKIDKSKLRKDDKDVDGKFNEDGGSDEEEKIDLTLEKAKQSLRKKQRATGVNVRDMSKSIKSIGNQEKGKDKSQNKSAFNLQFQSRIDKGHSGPVVHEHILEEYIAEKMGTNKEDSKGKEEEDAKVDVMKSILPTPVLEAIGVVEADEGQPVGQGAALNSLLSEVELPQTYKQRNVIETEEARKYLMQQQQSHYCQPELKRDKPHLHSHSDLISSKQLYGTQRFQRSGFNVVDAREDAKSKSSNVARSTGATSVPLPVEVTVLDEIHGKDQRKEYTGPIASDNAVFDHFRKMHPRG